jgi:hypothetical protein
MLRTLLHLSSSASSPWRRRLGVRAGVLAVLGAVGATALAACSSISLSTGSDFSGSPATSGGASSDAGGGATVSFADDAGVATPAPTLLGSPLCNLRVGSDDGGAGGDRVCDPDDVEDGGSLQCSVPDAGAELLDAAAVLQHNDSGTEADDGGSPSDAGEVTTPVDANPPATLTAGLACHVAAPDASAAAPQACIAAGAGKDGTECQKSDDCANGFECVGSPGQCRHYCCGGNSVCAVTYAPSFCNPEPVVSTTTFLVPVCIPISGCSLFGKCPTGQTCGVVKDDGTTSCVPIGPQIAGEECDTADCATGLTCVGSVGSRTCYQLCHVASTSECPTGTACTGSAQLFQDPQYGICR